MRHLAWLSLVVAGCMAEPDPLYLDVDMHLGTVDEPRLGGDWSTGWVVLDEDLQALPPGVFTVRVRAHDSDVVLTDVVQWIDRSSRCTFKSAPACADGACLSELVQTELGLCLIDMTATTDLGPAAGCWFLGTFPDDPSGNNIISPAEGSAIDSRSCSGTR